MFILVDEIMMGIWQRRIGPLNIGLYGILSVFMNGFNLIITYMVIPNIYYSLVFQCTPIIYLICGVCVYNMMYPFYGLDYGMSLLGIIYINGMGLLCIVFSGWSGSSKYSIIGGFRIISQFISLEFIFSCMYYVWIFRYYSMWVE
jgi:NADH:ubiquinone oxidoreductase subunit H